MSALAVDTSGDRVASGGPSWIVRTRRQVPFPIRTVLGGWVACGAGTLLWPVLLGLNTRLWPTVPWAVIVEGLHLWLFMRYVRGLGPPAGTAAARRRAFRANALPVRTWRLALLTGGLGSLGLFTAVVLAEKVAGAGRAALPELTSFPFWTVLAWLVTGSLVAGVAEEAAFRGFMQSRLEERYGPKTAILVTGIAFGMAHASHSWWHAITRMPVYLAGSVVYGVLTYRTGSVLPTMVLHGIFDTVLFVLLWWRGPFVSGGPGVASDPTVWLTAGAAVLLGLAAAASYPRLARAAAEDDVAREVGC